MLAIFLPEDNAHHRAAFMSHIFFILNLLQIVSIQVDWFMVQG